MPRKKNRPSLQSNAEEGGGTPPAGTPDEETLTRESEAAASPPPGAFATSEPEIPPVPKQLGWPAFAKQASEIEIRERFVREAAAIVKNSSELANAAVLAILRPEDSISSFELDQVYNALMDRDDDYKDVILILLSRGGEIEPAYQISKICKTFSKNGKFLVVVPRQAKSAATLIALGADEIHIGPLGQLGPIDPQIAGLPALGVAQALQTIAVLVERYPKSADMFAKYLRLAVQVEQIGYSDRVAASAVQYAERLLASKPHLSESASTIANTLVYSYKDHNFVIDADEAYRLLGGEWVHIWSSLDAAAERIYNLFDWSNLWISAAQRKQRLVVAGSFAINGVFLLNT